MAPFFHNKGGFMLSKQEVEKKRDRWAEEVLSLLEQQRPIDARRLAREWKAIILAEQEAEESQHRRQEAWISGP
jgi:hypothetical protein